MYYVVLVIFVACFLFIQRVVTSPFGQVLKMIRENEPRAISLGYEVDRYKLLAFVLSAALSGLAGSLKCLVMGLASLTDVDWTMSGEVILMSLLGGVGTFLGPVIGSVLVISLQDTLADKVGRLGDGDHRRDLRGLRAGLPQGHRRRGARLARPAQGEGPGLRSRRQKKKRPRGRFFSWRAAAHIFAAVRSSAYGTTRPCSGRMRSTSQPWRCTLVTRFTCNGLTWAGAGTVGRARGVGVGFHQQPFLGQPGHHEALRVRAAFDEEHLHRARRVAEGPGAADAQQGRRRPDCASASGRIALGVAKVCSKKARAGSLTTSVAPVAPAARSPPAWSKWWCEFTT
jgi:hypothetical protein